VLQLDHGSTTLLLFGLLSLPFAHMRFVIGNRGLRVPSFAESLSISQIACGCPLQSANSINLIHKAINKHATSAKALSFSILGHIPGHPGPQNDFRLWMSSGLSHMDI
jgi:hypothetical protein